MLRTYTYCEIHTHSPHIYVERRSVCASFLSSLSVCLCVGYITHAHTHAHTHTPHTPHTPKGAKKGVTCTQKHTAHKKRYFIILALSLAYQHIQKCTIFFSYVQSTCTNVLTLITSRGNSIWYHAVNLVSASATTKGV